MITGAMDKNDFSSKVAKFAFKFCNELDRNKSVVSSPLSAEIALALLTLAANEPTHSELLTALDIPNNDAIRSSISALSEMLKTIKGVTLNFANRVYVRDGPYGLNPRLQEDAVNVFDAGIEKIDFSQRNEAVQHINQWVESKTNKKITNLFSPENLKEDTLLVFINALYFSGKWSTKFDPTKTTDQPFHINADQTILVPMMYRHSTFNHGRSQELDATFLQMFYEGGESSMVIVLPQNIEGLDDMIHKLASGYDLMADLEQMHPSSLCVSVPKFKIETELNLKELLPKLGIKSIFNRSKSGINNLLDPPTSMYVHTAIQKAFIEVNESGTEAAVATGFTKRPISRPKTFQANRPFLYLLLGPASHVLFIGIYNGK